MKKEEVDKILDEARELYNLGKWMEAREKLSGLRDEELTKEQLSKKYRVVGWSLYYIGKKNIENPKKMGEEAAESFEKVIELGILEDVNSVLAGLPLVYQYLLGDTQKAIEVAKKRVEEAPDNRTKAVALNSLGCMQRDSGLILDALRTFNKAQKIIRKTGDHRTFGHILNNRAVTLMKIVPYLRTSACREKFKKEIKITFELALAKYGQFEEISGQSAQFHKEGIREKLKELKDL